MMQGEHGEKVKRWKRTAVATAVMLLILSAGVGLLVPRRFRAATWPPAMEAAVARFFRNFAIPRDPAGDLPGLVRQSEARA